MKLTLFIFLTLLFLAGVFTPGYSAIPKENETVYYQIIAYNGKEFSSTFCANISDDIYLLAHSDNFVNIYQSLIYKWEITNKYYLDYKKLNIPIIQEHPGKVEIYKNRKFLTSIEPTFYVYYKTPDKYNETKWEVYTGDEAKKRYNIYLQEITKYKNALNRYEQQMISFKESYNKKVAKIAELHRKGLQKKAEALMKKVIKEAQQNYPKRPKPPSIQVPNPQLGDVINLPAGEYTIWYRLKNGMILQESEKKLHVFNMRRKGIVGYKILPEDKWTKPIVSSIPNEIIYTNGRTDLFFQPNIENEYPELFINRLMDNQAFGNKNIWSWTIVKSLHEGTISLAPFHSSIKKTVNEVAYFVKQAPTKRLGYTILPYNEVVKSGKEITPSFYAFKIKLKNRQYKSLYVNYIYPNNKKAEGSLRIIKVITHDHLPYIFILFVITPFIVGIVVMLVRNRRFTE